MLIGRHPGMHALAVWLAVKDDPADGCLKGF
jgi:hypothetical protein